MTGLIAAALSCGSPLLAQGKSAERLLMDGRLDDAVRTLKAELAARPNDGDASLLLCRAYYAGLQTDDAVRACQGAVGLLPNNSDAQDWMGRAYGLRADKAGPLSGLKLAHEVHDAFEAAVRLNPQSAAAANDLSEYYIGAPAIVGGGLDKAEALAARIENDLPEVSHRIRAMSAEKRKDYATAEREFMAAVAVRHRGEAWVDLGGFYRRRRQDAKAVDALEHAIAADPSRGAPSVDAASYLIDLQAEPELAMKTLQQYLVGPGKTDAAPVVRVYVLIGKLKASNGDKAGAKIELSKALGLAANYGPARQAMKGL